MRNNTQHLRDGATKRCPICDGRFGLIRRYSWRTALCSKSCVDRFKERQEADRKWLSCLARFNTACIVHCIASGGAE
jgi:hypothetical protein